MAVTVKCAWCGKELKRSNSAYEKSKTKRFYCNYQCQGQWFSDNNRGENHPLWNRVEVSCSWCGEKKTTKHSEFKKYQNHFCNTECHDKWQKGKRTGEDSQHWKGGPERKECAWCGQEVMLYAANFQGKKNIYCSYSCMGKHYSKIYVGENHPTWTRINVACACCGKTIKIPKNKTQRTKNQFCSKACHHRWLSENIKGEAHPHWQRVKIPCTYCGRLLDVGRAKVNENKNHYCSYACMGEHRSKTNMYLSAGNPNWRGGISFEPYPVEWNGMLKKSVRERDASTCQHCGKPEAESRRRLDVHHIDYNKDNLDPENLISLCISCHGKTHGRRKYWKSYFIRMRASRWTRIKNFWLAVKN